MVSEQISKLSSWNQFFFSGSKPGFWSTQYVFIHTLFTKNLNPIFDRYSVRLYCSNIHCRQHHHQSHEQQPRNSKHNPENTTRNPENNKHQPRQHKTQHNPITQTQHNPENQNPKHWKNLPRDKKPTQMEINPMNTLTPTPSQQVVVHQDNSAF